MHNKIQQKTIVLVVYFLVGLGTVYSQIYPIKNFFKKDGLSASSVTCIHQCSRGYLWFGTSRGLCKFDGRHFFSFKTGALEEQAISSIYEDPDGVFWLGTLRDGLLRVSPEDGTQLAGLEEFKDCEIISMAKDADGLLWVGTGDGLYTYKAGLVNAYEKEDGDPFTRINCVIAAKKGRVWVAARSGVYYLERNRIEKLNIPLNPANKDDLTLMEDSKGHLWIGTLEGAICYRDNQYKVYTVNEGLSENNVFQLLEDAGGRIWIGTANGLNVLSNDCVISITTKNGLAGNFIYSMLQDGEGNMWVATHRGVSCVKSLDIATYTKRDGLADNTVYNILQDKKGRYWIGTPEGLSCFNGREIKTYTTRDGLPVNYILSLLEDGNGRIWIGTYKGMAYFSSNKCVPFSRITGSVLAMAKTRDGSIYVGLVDGLIRMKNSTLVPLPFKGDFPSVSCMLEDRRGNLWIAYRGGLYKYSPKGSSYFNPGNGKLKENLIYAMHEDSKGDLWLGSKAGLSRYQKGSFVHHSAAGGLPDNACFSIVEDLRGNLWIGTGNGLVCFDGRDFETYTSLRHGLPSDDWSRAITDNRGRLWFGSPGGVTRLSPPIKRNRIPPPVYITGLKGEAEKELNQLPLDSLRNTDSLPESLLQLNYRESYIDIHYEGLCFSSPESVVYRYRLEGMAHRETRRDSVSFANLAPGSYRFEVTAINNDGMESLEPATVEFEILPPFWGTWWFRLLVIVAAAAFSGFLVFLRYRRAGEKSEMEAKNRQLIMAQRMELVGGLAAGTVHDLKNMLSIILSYTRLISRKLDPQNEDRRHLETIKDTAATAVQMTKQILSLTRSPSDSEENTNLGKLLEEILDTLEVTLPQKIETCWVLPEDQIHLGINPARFQQVMLNLCW
ncbi:MAG: hypothetical protein GY765_41090, partial [bacterium]|nr:hypothetical protein [bacterium]